MKITWDRDNAKLTYGNKTIQVVCAVRNELNGERLLSEVPVYGEGLDGKDTLPYMPRPFPKGTWSIGEIIPKNNPYEAPEFISTDAHQLVHPWTTQDGHYGRQIDDLIEDYGYGLHNSTSSTTLGCGHILELEDRQELCDAIQEAFDRKEPVVLEVS